MAEEVAKQWSSGGFVLSILPLIPSLHGYTHGGLEQLARPFSPGFQLKPDYTDEEIKDVVKVTTAHFTALALVWCRAVSGNVVCSDFISEKYSEVYGRKEII